MFDLNPDTDISYIPAIIIVFLSLDMQRPV